MQLIRTGIHSVAEEIGEGGRPQLQHVVLRQHVEYFGKRRVQHRNQVQLPSQQGKAFLNLYRYSRSPFIE